MNGATITRLPTLCVPEKLSREQLVEQVNHLQDSLLMQGHKLHEESVKLAETRVIANHLATQLQVLMDSCDAGDQAAILLQVKKLAQQRTAKKGRVH